LFFFIDVIEALASLTFLICELFSINMLSCCSLGLADAGADNNDSVKRSQNPVISTVQENEVAKKNCQRKVVVQSNSLKRPINEAVSRKKMEVVGSGRPTNAPAAATGSTKKAG
jgi:hypothetical protein